MMNGRLPTSKTVTIVCEDMEGTARFLQMLQTANNLGIIGYKITHFRQLPVIVTRRVGYELTIEKPSETLKTLLRHEFRAKMEEKPPAPGQSLDEAQGNE